MELCHTWSSWKSIIREEARQMDCDYLVVYTSRFIKLSSLIENLCGTHTKKFVLRI